MNNEHIPSYENEQNIFIIEIQSKNIDYKSCLVSIGYIKIKH